MMAASAIFLGLAAIGAVWRDHLDAVSAQLLVQSTKIAAL
jgi:hypothetical protein